MICFLYDFKQYCLNCHNILDFVGSIYYPGLCISQNHSEGPLVAIYLCLQCFWAMHAVQISVGEATVKTLAITNYKQKELQISKY